jgi:hypothetical protein
VISLFNDPHDCQHQIVNLEMAALGLPPNNSLDAGGVSGLLIYNLSVAQSSAAASTQTLCAKC